LKTGNACRSESGGLLGELLFFFFRHSGERRNPEKIEEPGTRSQRTEDRGQRAEGRGQKSEVGDQRSEVGDKRSERSGHDLLADGGFIDGKEKNLDPGSVIPAEAGTGVTEKRRQWKTDQGLSGTPVRDRV